MIYIIVKTKDARRHREEVRDALSDLKKEVKRSGLMSELRDRQQFRTNAERHRIKRDRAASQRRKDLKLKEKNEKKQSEY